MKELEYVKIEVQRAGRDPFIKKLRYIASGKASFAVCVQLLD